MSEHEIDLGDGVVLLTPADRKRERPNHVLARDLARLDVQEARTRELAALELSRGNRANAEVLLAVAADIARDRQRRIGTHDTGRTGTLPPTTTTSRVTRDPITAGSGHFLDKPIIIGEPTKLANVRAEAELDAFDAKQARLAAREAKRLANREARRRKARRER
jgi:hypothetical protein